MLLWGWIAQFLNPDQSFTYYYMHLSQVDEGQGVQVKGKDHISFALRDFTQTKILLFGTGVNSDIINIKLIANLIIGARFLFYLI